MSIERFMQAKICPHTDSNAYKAIDKIDLRSVLTFVPSFNFILALPVPLLQHQDYLLDIVSLNSPNDYPLVS
jgi:hypothetical protein